MGYSPSARKVALHEQQGQDVGGVAVQWSARQVAAMTGGRLRFAGWLAMASALLTLPLFLFSLQNQGQTDFTMKVLDAGIQVLGAALFVFLCVTLRRFLGRRFSFHATDRIIGLMIVSNLAIGGLTLAATFAPQLQPAASAIAVGAVFAMGVLQLRFGFLLLALSDELGGLRRPYAYLNMAVGACLASIVLVPLAIVLSAVADVMLGTIFLQAARSIDTTA
jgi:hypothetical protein